jgi:hypothetical protein
MVPRIPVEDPREGEGLVASPWQEMEQPKD